MSQRQERDPFFESVNTEVQIGSTYVYLRSLAFMMEMEELLPISDFKGQEKGSLRVELMPCSVQGKEITEDYVESPGRLVEGFFSLISWQ